MKHTALVMAFMFGLTGCSHAYIRQFGNGQVTACCPQKKLACSKSALDDLAVKQCDGPAKAISGGSIDSGSFASLYGSSYAEAGTTRDMCVRYACTESSDVSATEQSRSFAEERAEQDKKVLAICANDEFKAYYAKTPCLATEMNLSYLTDANKLSNSERHVLLKVQPAITQILRDTSNLYRSKGGSKGVSIAEAFDKMMASAEQNSLDLYNHKITWGEYNKARKDIANTVLESFKQITQSNAR